MIDDFPEKGLCERCRNCFSESDVECGRLFFGCLEGRNVSNGKRFCYDFKQVEKTNREMIDRRLERMRNFAALEPCRVCGKKH